MSLPLSTLGRIFRASLAPLFLSALVIGCGPSDVGTIKAGSKEEVQKDLFPKAEGQKLPKGSKGGEAPSSGPTASPPGKKR